MPISRDALIREAASFKGDVSKEFDKVVKALIDLAWEKGDPSMDFSWEEDPRLDAEANALLRGLSDTLAEKAKRRAEAVIRASLEFYHFEEDWEEVGGEDYDSLLFRLDMQGSHLKELLAVWIALAVANRIGRSELRVMVSRYLNNPYASPLWKGVRPDALKWGRGYSRNIADQLTVIGQTAIIGTARLAEWEDQREKGATYYIRRRGSYYDCDTCNGLANKPIPIETPFEVPHARCCCYPEYFFEPIP